MKITRINHVAYNVAGVGAGGYQAARLRFREDDLDVGQAFRNSYEQTKCEAETLVRAWHGRGVTC